MTSTVLSPMVLSLVRRASIAATMCIAMVGLAGSPAHARVFFGFGFPFYGPAYYPPPVYYPPPPVYYAPPPTVYAPPVQTYSQAPYSPAPRSAGQLCYAGPYVCPMEHPTAAGANCYCLGNGSARVWGRAN